MEYGLVIMNNLPCVYCKYFLLLICMRTCINCNTLVDILQEEIEELKQR